MPVYNQEGDIFKAPVNVICHQCNCFHTMGGGIAYQIAKLFPEAEIADNETKYGDMNKLGTMSITSAASYKNENPNIKYIANLYGQYNYGTRYGPATEYDALESAFMKLKEFCIKRKEENEHLIVGIPHKIGCQLAGGDWNIVSAIIDKVFGDKEVEAVIYKYDPKRK